MFICGSFHPKKDTECSSSNKSNPCSKESKPKESRKSGILCRSKSTMNPYANRGLEKFSSLLADLEEKKQKIYTKKGAEDISLVRFVYLNSNQIKPIVVKLKKQEQSKTSFENGKEKQMSENSEAIDYKHSVESSKPVNNEVVQKRKDSDQETKKKKTKKSFAWINMNLDNWRNPSYYMPVVIILILMMLVVFGRSFVILCTSVGWYLVPSVNGGSSILKKTNKKKEYGRRFSYQSRIGSDGFSSSSSSSPKLASPRSVITGPVKDKSSGQHGFRKSW